MAKFGIDSRFVFDTDGKSVQTKLTENLNKRSISVLDYIPVNERDAVINGTSTIDHTVYVQQAVDSVDVLDFSRCKKIVINGTVVLPAKVITLIGVGSVINSTSGLPIFKQRKRGYFTKIEGITFTGNSIAFDYDSDDVSLPNHTSNREYHIINCRFLQSSGVYAIRLYGAREGYIEGCYFQDNNCIYTEFSINSVISNCQFKGTGYMVLSKLGSEGLILSNVIAIGCANGIICERTTGVQIMNSMIDYCDIPVHLKGATDVLISNNYISTRTANPAITTVKYDDGFLGGKYLISNNNIRTNSAGGEVAVKLEDIYDGSFVNNIVANYKVNGIEYGNMTNFKFANNTIRAASGSGVNSIQNLASGDNATVIIESNNVTKPIVRTLATLHRNAGFKTDGRGEAVIANAQTSVVVNHGLAITPNKLDIMLTPTTPNTSGLNYYVSAVGATTLTITINPAATGTVAFVWKIV